MGNLDASNFIQLLGILVSLLTSVIAIIISLKSIKQNSEMIKNASKPVISIYIDAITICEQTSFFVLKNFGTSPAKITHFTYDSVLKTTPQKFPLLCEQFDYVNGIILAPGQTKLLEYDVTKLPVDTVHFHIDYSFGNCSDSEDITLNVKNYIHIPVTRKDTFISSGNERQVLTLREMLERSM